MNRSSWHVRVGSVVGVWAVAWVVALFANTWLPASSWLMIHLLTLGVVSNAIFIWTWHFAETLLRLRDPGHAGQVRRLIVLNAGIVTLVVAMMTDVPLLLGVGAGLVVLSALWHLSALAVRMRTALANRFAVTVRYYVVAGAMLVVGGVLGGLMAEHTLAAHWHPALHLAHLIVNVLGWVGLTVTGTLVTLWPTMVRTRMAAGAEAATRRALPLLAGGAVLAAGLSFTEYGRLVALGLAVYLAGLVVALVPFVRAMRQRRPDRFATWSVLAGVVWLVGTVAGLLGVGIASSRVSALQASSDWVVPALLVGAVFQILVGAMSYLIPVVLGGGPRQLRRTIADVDRAGTVRLAVVNAGLPICLLPVPRLVLSATAAAVVAGAASSVVLLVVAVIRQRRRLKGDGPGATLGPPVKPDAPTAAEQRLNGARHAGGLLIGIGVVVAAVVVGTAADPSAAGIVRSPTAPSSAPSVAGVTAVTLKTEHMRFVPDTVQVPVGNRLVITIDNEDVLTHDLVLATGPSTGRIRPAATRTLDVGVITADIEGWCSIPGHRQMGMVFHVQALPAAGETAAASPSPTMDMGHDHSATPSPGGDSTVTMADLMQEPPAGFRARDAAVPPAQKATVHRVKLVVTETEHEVAPGVTQKLWTYNGTAPGPILRGKVGDTFVVTLTNDGSMGHSIDFHAGALAPDKPMRTIDPGESLTYTFTATRSGIWLYHCSTMPMSLHIANGMFGAVIIEPPGLPKVDQEYVLIQSELYLGPQGGIADLSKIQAERPDLVVFNGYPMQYYHRPLTAKVGERVRIWVLDAGPDKPSSFHVVGGQFDTVWTEGAYRLQAPPGSGKTGGAQVLPLAVAQGGFVELTFPQAGHYTFVSHVMTDAERGAMGRFTVTR